VSWCSSSCPVSSRTDDNTGVLDALRTGAEFVAKAFELILKDSTNNTTKIPADFKNFM
jgi:hypothetical protein